MRGQLPLVGAQLATVFFKEGSKLMRRVIGGAGKSGIYLNPDRPHNLHRFLLVYLIRHAQFYLDAHTLRQRGLSFLERISRVTCANGLVQHVLTRNFLENVKKNEVDRMSQVARRV